MKKFIAVMGMLSFGIVSAQDLDSGLGSLSNQIAEGLIDGNKQKIAIIEFSDLDGNITEFGKFISEELITKLFSTNKVNVIERQLLNKIIDEHRLKFTGLIDESTAKELGRILGVEAICSGTITDLGSKIKINARLISTETGSIFSVAAVAIIKDDVVSKLMNKQPYLQDRKGINTPVVGKGAIFFKEDFSKYDIGDPVSQWGSNFAVILSRTDGKKYISAQDENIMVPIGLRINFPQNFTFGFELTGGCGTYEKNHIYFTLINSKDEEIKIFMEGCATFTAQLPGTDKMKADGYDYQNMQNVKITKNNGVIKVYFNGSFVVSGYFENFGDITAFKISSYLGRYGYANFIGIAQ